MEVIIYIILFTLPLVIGGIIAIINSTGVNNTIEKFEAWIRKRQQKTSINSGWFAKYIINPMLWLIVKFSDWTDGFAHRGFKNGVRIATTLYLIAIWLFLLYAVFIIVVIIVIAVIILWIVFKLALNSNEDVKKGYKQGKNIVSSSKIMNSMANKSKIYKGYLKGWDNKPILTVIEGKVFEGDYDGGGSIFEAAKQVIMTIIDNKIIEGDNDYTNKYIAKVESNVLYVDEGVFDRKEIARVEKDNIQNVFVAYQITGFAEKKVIATAYDGDEMVVAVGALYLLTQTEK